MEDLKTELLSRVGPCLWRLYAEDSDAGWFTVVLSDDAGRTKCFLPTNIAALQGMPYLTEQWARARLEEVRCGPTLRSPAREWHYAPLQTD